MTRKNIFNFIIIYIISFLSLFYNFDIRTNKNDNARYIKFIFFNEIYANEDNYEYNVDNNIVRTNKKDPGLNGNFSNEATKILSNLDWIPGVGTMAKSFTYIGQGLNLGWNDIKKAFTGDISSILVGAGMIISVVGMSDGDANSVMSLDQTFSSNLYCRYQNIYEEETDLIHRSGPASRGGLEHPIFPIYPLDIKVNSETGLCDLNEVIDNNFIDIGNANKSGNHLQPSTTKCSYSYTAASEQCIKDLGEPILIAYEIQNIAASVVCTIASAGASIKSAQKAAQEAVENAVKEASEKASKEVLEEAAQKAMKEAAEKGLNKAAQEAAGEAAREAAKEAAEEAAEKAAKLAFEKASEEAAKELVRETKNIYVQTVLRSVNSVSRGILSFFTDTRFIYDPINFMAILGVEFTMDFLFTAITGVIPPTPPNLISLAICLIGKISAYTAFTYASKSTIAIMSHNHYNEAKDAIKNYKFCGHDWFTYAKTSDKKYYTKGIYANSYYKKIYDCINSTTDKEGNECNKISDNNVCDGSDNFCKNGANQKITKTNKDIKNKVFREYVYGGKEYEAGAIEENIVESGNDADNRVSLFKDGGYDRNFCIDPRTPEQKGFNSIYQKYYMRGNDKANFACNRFYYDGKSPCILYQDQIYDEDKIKMAVKYENGKYYLLPDGDENKELRNKYSKQCQEAFIEARKCCQYRSRHLICLENQKTNNNAFCFSNVVEEYSDENTKMANNIVVMLQNVQNNGDFFKYTCELDGVKFEATKKIGTNHICVFSYGMCPYDFKLNAGLNYKATYCDANTVDPNLDTSNTIKRGSTHFNADDCRKGIFSADMREEYKSLSKESSKFASYVFDKVSNDVGCNSSECIYNRDDFKTIYNYDKVNSIIEKIRDGDSDFSQFSTSDLRILSELGCDPSSKDSCLEKFDNIFEKGFGVVIDKPLIAITKYNLSQYLINNLKTSAYGQIKNFCQYRAHCVEVEEERLMEEREDNSTLFMDSSCTGYTNNSRNILQGSTVGLPRQLSTPIVECIHESLKNLVNGVAGNSLCLDGHAINNEGFCDSDTAEDVETAIKNKDTEFFNKKYQIRYDDIEDKNVYIVKGQLLPTNYNPFLKLQKRFINIIRVVLTLFLVIYFYKLFLLGKIGDFTRPENVGKLVFNLFKFSLVIWLIFYNGWQQGVYERLVNFSSGTFNFVNNILIKVINNPNNQMLSLKGDKPKQLNIEKYDKLSETEDEDFKAICYRYDIFNNIQYKTINDITGYCDTGYTRVEKNQIYIAEKEDKIYQEKGKLVISTNQEMSKFISFIDEYNDTNSNKFILYRINENGQNVSIEADNNPKGEDLYGKNAINYKSEQITKYDKENVWSKYYDGCYFDTTEYKEGKGYLALFDTLDCKFIRYLGFSTDRMVPNLIIFSVMMMAPKYLLEGVGGDSKGVDLITRVISTVGSVLFGLVMSFVFIMFNVLIKVLYVFLSSFFTLSILIFVSPIILPLLFYERTKKMVDTWFELVIDTVIKPTFNLCIMIFYVNLLDIVLLKNVMFIKHDWRGRGASLECFSGSASSFVCLINNLIGGLSPNDIKGLFADGLMSFLLDMLMVIMLFTLSDSMLETFNSIVKEIFNFVSNGSGASVMGLSGGNSVAESEGKSTEDAILGKKTNQKDENGNAIREGGAMGVGKSIEAFRSDYLTKAPGAMLDSFINKTTKDGKAVGFSDIKNSDELKKDKNDKTSKKIGKAILRGVGYIGSAVSYAGSGLNTARQFLRDKDEALRASASRLVKINAKRASDSIKSKVSTVGENLKTAFRNINSDDKVNKLKEDIEKRKEELKESEEKFNENDKWYHPIKRSYYKNKNQKLKDEIYEMEDELLEREENDGKLKYRKLSDSGVKKELEEAEEFERENRIKQMANKNNEDKFNDGKEDGPEYGKEDELEDIED